MPSGLICGHEELPKLVRFRLGEAEVLNGLLLQFKPHGCKSFSVGIFRWAPFCFQSIVLPKLPEQPDWVWSSNLTS